MKKILFSLALVPIVCALSTAQDTPKAEVFLGYTYTRVNSASNVPAFSSNGGGGQFVLNLGRWVGAVADVGAVHNGNVGGYHLDTTLTNFLFGPRITIRESNRVTPYFQTLFGGVYGATSTKVELPPDTPIINPLPPTSQNLAQAVGIRASTGQTAFAMAVGGGLDIKISHHLSFRPIGLDYYMTRLQNLRTANDNNQHNLRYTTGFNFTFGGESPEPPPPPPMTSCWNGTSVPAGAECPKRGMQFGVMAAQAEVCPGAAVTITPSGEIPQGASLAWSVNGEAVSQGPSFEFGTTGRNPGTYTISVAASAPEYDEASARTVVTLLPYRPPSGSLEVSPSEILAGQRATVTPKFIPGQCGGSLKTPVVTASEGTVNEGQFDSSGVQFDPADNSEQRKTVKLVAQVADEKSTGTAEATVVVRKTATIMAKRLPDIIFPAASARVNNCGKRVLLDELKSLVDRDPTGKIVFVGHITGNEKEGLDRERALNSAAVVSAGQGICTSFPANQVLVSAAGAADNGVDLQPLFCGTSTVPKVGELSGQMVKESDEQAKYRRVEVWFVPSGGNLPASVKDYQEASALSVSSLGCPK